MKVNILQVGKNVLRNEARAILFLEKKIGGHDFIKAVRLLREAKGKIVISGIGKSGIVARKLAATLSSTGTFSLFVHPVEALHGDLGMIAGGDVLIAISHSGETPELNAFVHAARHLPIKLIVITADGRSSLAKNADATILTHVSEEACKICRTFNLAPTASSIVALAVGDALGAALQELKAVNLKHFARVHQGGALGKTYYRHNKKKHGKANE